MIKFFKIKQLGNLFSTKLSESIMSNYNVLFHQNLFFSTINILQMCKL